MYIVYYNGGDWGQFFRREIFVTANKKTATKYVTRFNRILRKWKAYYNSIAKEGRFGEVIFPEDSNLQDRYYQITDIKRCDYRKIQVR